MSGACEASHCDPVGTPTAGASDVAINLLAELLVTNALSLSNCLWHNKYRHERQALAIMECPVDFPIDVVSVTGVAAFNGGTAFGVRRWSQLWLLIYFGLRLHSLSAEEREATRRIRWRSEMLWPLSRYRTNRFSEPPCGTWRSRSSSAR